MQKYDKYYKHIRLQVIMQVIRNKVKYKFACRDAVF